VGGIGVSDGSGVSEGVGVFSGVAVLVEVDKGVSVAVAVGSCMLGTACTTVVLFDESNANIITPHIKAIPVIRRRTIALFCL
jgi:hypothetical protein